MEWKTEALGDIAFMTSGGTPSTKNPEYYKDGTIPWVRSGELENGAIRDTEIRITQAGLDNSSAKIFPKGTLLIALYGATIGKLAYLDIDACTNQAVCGIFENEKVSLKYLYYFLLFHRPDLVKQGIGGAQSNISQTILKKLLVSYPVDKREQHRIVSRIEELFSELDNGVETLQKTKQQLAVYRQAVLKQAFEGHLTERWRTENQKANEWKTTSIMSLIQQDKHSLKAGPFGSALKKECYVPLGYKVYGQEQVIAGNEEIGDYYISEEKYTELNTCKVAPRDVLISLVGTVGKVLVLSDNCKPGIINPRLIKVSLNTDKMVPRFFKYYFESGYLRSLYKEKAHGATMDVLNMGMIKELPFAWCPVEEQKKVIEEIESRLSLCENIEKTVDTSLQQAEAMRQSILKQAFEGRL